MSDKILNVVNGDAAADRIKGAGLAGDVLVWRDVLHDGPVPGGLSMSELSMVRAKFLAEGLDMDGAELQRNFLLRDAHLGSARDYDRVVLWFEHDLYDQLQILQLLDWFAENSIGEKLWMICIDHFEGIDPFHGLGQLTEDNFKSLVGTEVPVDAPMLDLGQKAWAAFRSDNPSAWAGLLEEDLTSLPFLSASVLRFLEEFPAPQTGLGRTERGILEVLESDEMGPGPLFQAVLLKEEAPFMGDWSFWRLVEELTSGPVPFLTTRSGKRFRHPPELEEMDVFIAQLLKPTDEGRAVLAGGADRVALGGYHRWFGNVEMKSGEVVWRWDPSTKLLKKDG